jgi:hypothetical protein
MRKTYRILAYTVAAEVVVQAMLMVYAIAGLLKWVGDGGVFDKAVMEEHEIIYPEIIGIPLHGMNGGILIPIIALVLLICSFFAKIPGGAKWAGLVLVLAVVQGQLGYLGPDLPAAGMLHGLNALALFVVALHAARRARVEATSTTPAVEPEPVRTPV